MQSKWGPSILTRKIDFSGNKLNIIKNIIGVNFRSTAIYTVWGPCLEVVWRQSVCLLERVVTFGNQLVVKTIQTWHTTLLRLQCSQWWWWWWWVWNPRFRPNLTIQPVEKINGISPQPPNHDWKPFNLIWTFFEWLKNDMLTTWDFWKMSGSHFLKFL